MPDFWNVLVEATAKAIPTLVVAVATLALGWFVGTGVTSRWEEFKKRRTLELEALARFYSLYGEFFAVWKVWSVHKQARYLVNHERQSEEVWDILRRAADIEGGFEAILVRLTQERVLSGLQVRDLARFREGYQCLRQAIRSDQALNWWNKEHGDDGFAQYTAFKELASAVASLLSTESARLVRQPVRPTPEDAMQSLIGATGSSQFRKSWWESPPVEGRGSSASITASTTD